MSVGAAIAAFDQHRATFLDDLLTFLRFKTVSTSPGHAAELRECAGWVRGQLALAGLEAEVIPTAGHPAVYADTGPLPGAAGRPTLLFYGHYDVQPTGDERLWSSPPFEPAIREGAIYARGSADDKGQVMTHLAAMRSWRMAGGEWPVRIKFFIEGEEEIGSAHLPEFIRRHADRLACDYVVISDTSKLDGATPALTYATRGLVYKHIIIDGPSRDLHSGLYGGAVANPANVLARVIASLHDDRHRVTIPGFYDDVLPLTDEERRRLAEHGLSDAELLAATGSPATWGEEGFTSAERRTARPALDVNGLVSGYTGEGSATVIPARASAKVSMRIVAGQRPEAISQAFDEAVRARCPAAVRLRIEQSVSCAPYVAPLDSPGMQAARKALTEAFGRPPVLTREGGTLPILPLFKEVLGAESLMLGFAAPDCNLHGPNEFFHIRDFEVGTRCILRFLDAVAAT